MSDRKLIEAAARLCGLKGHWIAVPMAVNIERFILENGQQFDPRRYGTDREAVLMALWDRYEVLFQLYSGDSPDAFCAIALTEIDSRRVMGRQVELASDHPTRDQAYAYALLRAVAQIEKGE